METNVLVKNYILETYSLRASIEDVLGIMEIIYAQASIELNDDQSLRFSEHLFAMEERWQRLVKVVSQSETPLHEKGDIGAQLLVCQDYMRGVTQFLDEWADGVTQEQLTELWENCWELYLEMTPSIGGWMKN